MKDKLKSLLFRLLGKDPEAVVVTFAAGDAELCRRMQEEVRGLVPDRRHFVVDRAEGDALRTWLALRRRFRRYRIGLAPVLLGTAPRPAAHRRLSAGAAAHPGLQHAPGAAPPAVQPREPALLARRAARPHRAAPALVAVASKASGRPLGRPRPAPAPWRDVRAPRVRASPCFRPIFRTRFPTAARSASSICCARPRGSSTCCCSPSPTATRRSMRRPCSNSARR